MSYYTNLEFKGIVKKEFREKLDLIISAEDFDNTEDKNFKKFSNEERANNILYEMFNDSYKKYDKETGLWEFKTSINYGEVIISKFLRLVPYFIESTSKIIVTDEDGIVKEYELKNNEVCLLKRI